MRLWYLSQRQPAKALASLHICTVSPESLLFAHIKYGSRQRVRPKIRHLAPLDGCTCAFEEWVYGGQKCHNLMRWPNYYAPNFEEVAGAYWFWVASPSVCSSKTVHARVLKFHIWIPHGKIIDARFFSCPSYLSFWSYAPLKKTEWNLMHAISYQPCMLGFWNFIYGFGIEK